MLAFLLLTAPAWSANNTTKAGEAVTSPTKATLFLSGVIIYGKERRALFEVRQGNSTTKKQVTEGEKIGGYTLDKVEKERVVLRHGDKSRILLLKRGTVEVAKEEVAQPAKKEVKYETKREKVEVVKRYKPGEIDLSQHKEDVGKGILKIMEILQQAEPEKGK